MRILVYATVLATGMVHRDDRVVIMAGRILSRIGFSPLWSILMSSPWSI